LRKKSYLEGKKVNVEEFFIQGIYEIRSPADVRCYRDSRIDVHVSFNCGYIDNFIYHTVNLVIDWERKGFLQ